MDQSMLIRKSVRLGTIWDCFAHKSQAERHNSLAVNMIKDGTGEERPGKCGYTLEELTLLSANIVK